MDQSRGVYDKRLLREAALLQLPDADEMKQHRHSYDRNLLNETATVHLQSPKRLEALDVHHSRTKPFWRTTRGKAVIALVCLAGIVGVVAGGTVGGTIQKHFPPSVTVSPGPAGPAPIPGTDGAMFTSIVLSSLSDTSASVSFPIGGVGTRPANLNTTTVTVTVVPSSSSSASV
ncbi:hypothetical protein AX14_005837 [Amanita brunnescens Koide BX004]|nr:hypothetical protein AX14_005837 [Amanita brunnescens Koide BX004]